MSLAALAIACASPERITISPDFSEGQISDIVDAADLWCGEEPSACLPVEISSERTKAIHLRPAKRRRSCEGETIGRIYWDLAHSPLIELCSQEKYPFRNVAAHELGHALAEKGDHAEHGNIMKPGTKTSDLFFLNDADLQFVRNQ